MIDKIFKLEDLPDFFNLAIIGKSNSGKTVLLKHILLRLSNKYKYCFLFIGSKTSFNANEYFKFFYDRNTCIVDKDNKNQMNFYLDNIKQWSQKNKESNIHSVVVFDDVGRMKLDNFTNECRHGNISTIFLIHDYKHLDKVTRQSLTVLCITQNTTNMDDILEEHLRSKSDKNKSIEQINTTFSKKKTDRRVYIFLDSINQQLYYYTISPEDYTETINRLFVFGTECPKVKESLKKIYDELIITDDTTITDNTSLKEETCETQETICLLD